MFPVSFLQTLSTHEQTCLSEIVFLNEQASHWRDRSEYWRDQFICTNNLIVSLKHSITESLLKSADSEVVLFLFCHLVV